MKTQSNTAALTARIRSLEKEINLRVRERNDQRNRADTLANALSSKCCSGTDLRIALIPFTRSWICRMFLPTLVKVANEAINRPKE